MSVRHLRDKVWNAFWVIPGACVAVAITLALTLPRIPLPNHGDLIFAGGPAGARSLLSAITSSMISLTAVVFSITMLAFVLASRQFSPRALRSFQRDHIVQLALGVFIATFTYAMIVLRSVRGTNTSNGYVPQLAVAVAFVLVLGSVAMFIAYIAHIANLLRASGLVAWIGKETQEALVVRHRLHARNVDSVAPGGTPARHVCAPSPGVLVSVRTGKIVDRARARAGTVVLKPRIGEFVPSGVRLFELYDGAARLSDAELLDAVSLATERSYEQDPAFGFRQLVDIAERSGSEDPTTSVQAIDMLHELLRPLAGRPDPSGHFADDTGRLRLVVPTTGFEEFLRLAVDEVAFYSAKAPRTLRRLYAMLLDLRDVALPAHLPAIEQRLHALEAEIGSRAA